MLLGMKGSQKDEAEENEQSIPHVQMLLVDETKYISISPLPFACTLPRGVKRNAGVPIEAVASFTKS